MEFRVDLVEKWMAGVLKEYRQILEEKFEHKEELGLTGAEFKKKIE